jgi:nucleotide-binding universal stress UspA family protein
VTIGQSRPEDWEDPVAIPEVVTPERVIVPFDGSHAAEAALGWAALVASGTGAEVIVVVAYDPPITVRGRGAAYVEESKAALAEEAHALAEESVSLLLERAVTARGLVVRGDVARAILEAAEDEQAGLIVMGRRGLTHEAGGAAERFLSILTGGVAEKVTRHAAVPVLLVP